MQWSSAGELEVQLLISFKFEMTFSQRTYTRRLKLSIANGLNRLSNSWLESILFKNGKRSTIRIQGTPDAERLVLSGMKHSIVLWFHNFSK